MQFDQGTTFSDETQSISTPLLLFKLLPGQTLRVTMRPSVSSSFFHASFSPVTHSFYSNTLYEENIEEKRGVLEGEKEREDFECHDKHRCFITNERGVASSFDFVVRTVGTISCVNLVEIAFGSISTQLLKMKKQLSLKQLVKVEKGNQPATGKSAFYHYLLRIPEVYQSAFVSMTKFHMNNGHTIANLIQGVLYNFYTLEKKDDLVLISYRKPSPLDIRQDHETLLDSEAQFPHALDPHIEYMFVWDIDVTKPFSDNDALERISNYFEFVKVYTENSHQHFQLAVEEFEKKMK